MPRNNLSKLWLMSILSLAATAGLASAQVPGGAGVPAGRPGFSPYLNLLRQGNPAYLNYYGLVRPQMQNQEAFGSLQGQIQANSTSLARIASEGSGGLPDTGKSFGYFNHQGYFLNNRSGGRGGMSQGGSGGVGQRQGQVGGGYFNQMGNQGGVPAVGRPR